MTSCCDDYGRCTQGANCCVRQSCAPEGADQHQRAMNAPIKRDAVDNGITLQPTRRQRVMDAIYSGIYWLGTLVLIGAVSLAFGLAMGFWGRS